MKEVKNYKPPVIRSLSSGDAVYSMVAEVNDTVHIVYLKIAKRADLKGSHHEKRKFMLYT